MKAPPPAARPTLAALAADLAAGRTTSRKLVEDCLCRISHPDGEGKRVFVKVYDVAARIAAEAQDGVVYLCAADKLRLSRFMIYCASYERRHHKWPVYGLPICSPIPRSSWISPA